MTAVILFFLFIIANCVPHRGNHKKTAHPKGCAVFI